MSTTGAVGVGVGGRYTLATTSMVSWTRWGQLGQLVIVVGASAVAASVARTLERRCLSRSANAVALASVLLVVVVLAGAGRLDRIMELLSPTEHWALGAVAATAAGHAVARWSWTTAPGWVSAVGATVAAIAVPLAGADAVTTATFRPDSLAATTSGLGVVAVGCVLTAGAATAHARRLLDGRRAGAARAGAWLVWGVHLGSSVTLAALGSVGAGAMLGLVALVSPAALASRREPATQAVAVFAANLVWAVTAAALWGLPDAVWLWLLQLAVTGLVTRLGVRSGMVASHRAHAWAVAPLLAVTTGVVASVLSDPVDALVQQSARGWQAGTTSANLGWWWVVSPALWSATVILVAPVPLGSPSAWRRIGSWLAGGGVASVMVATAVVPVAAWAAVVLFAGITATWVVVAARSGSGHVVLLASSVSLLMWGVASPAASVLMLSAVAAAGIAVAFTSYGARLAGITRTVAVTTGWAAIIALPATALAAANIADWRVWAPVVAAGAAIGLAGFRLALVRCRMASDDLRLVAVQTVAPAAWLVAAAEAGTAGRAASAVVWAIVAAGCASVAATGGAFGWWVAGWVAASTSSGFALVAADVAVIEAYTATPALLAVAWGGWRLLVDRHASSLRCLSVGLALALAPPSAAVVADPSDHGRVLAVASVAMMLLLAGMRWRLAALVVAGTAGVAALTAPRLVDLVTATPNWLVFAVGGVVLLAASVRFEHLRSAARSTRRWTSRFR